MPVCTTAGEALRTQIMDGDNSQSPSDPAVYPGPGWVLSSYVQLRPVGYSIRQQGISAGFPNAAMPTYVYAPPSPRKTGRLQKAIS